MVLEIRIQVPRDKEDQGSASRTYNQISSIHLQLWGFPSERAEGLSCV